MDPTGEDLQVNLRDVVNEYWEDGVKRVRDS